MNIRTETITKINNPKTHIHILTTYFPCITDAWFWAFKMCQNLNKISDVVIYKHADGRYYVGRVLTESDYNLLKYEIEMPDGRMIPATLIDMIQGRYKQSVGRGCSNMPGQIYQPKSGDEIWKANI